MRLLIFGNVEGLPKSPGRLIFICEEYLHVSRMGRATTSFAVGKHISVRGISHGSPSATLQVQAGSAPSAHFRLIAILIGSLPTSDYCHINVSFRYPTAITQGTNTRVCFSSRLQKLAPCGLNNVLPTRTISLFIGVKNNFKLALGSKLFQPIRQFVRVQHRVQFFRFFRPLCPA